MLLKFELAAAKQTRWTEYATRFLFGGSLTVIAGIIADKFGPGIGGLFLAFPAIFPASASLVYDHELEKKKEAGLDGTIRGRMVAGVEAAGTTMGCIALAMFALVCWKMLPHLTPPMTLLMATSIWAITSVTVWFARRRTLKLSANIRVLHTHTQNFRK